MLRLLITLTLGLAATALGETRPAAAPGAPVATGSAPAFRETVPVATAEDAADDPAVWRNRRRPADSLIVTTDKKRGLNVYGLDGTLVFSVAAGRLNNVDLRGGVRFPDGSGVLVAASDRTTPTQEKVALFRLNERTGVLTELGRFDADVGEAYGFCLWRRRDGALFGFVVSKTGAVSQLAIDVSGARPRVEVARRFAFQTQSEGCVADDRTGWLYVAEEDVGVWKTDADPRRPARPQRFASVDGRRLVADAEGLAIAPEGARGGLLIASSQGDSAYAAWRLQDGRYVGRFRIVASGTVDGTSETDGVEIALGDFGPEFPGGLMVAQDGDNAPHAQNFKLVRWRDVEKALGRR